MKNQKVIKPKFCKCKKCGYIWYSRFGFVPKTCPKCKRYDWNKNKKIKNIHEENGKQ